MPKKYRLTRADFALARGFKRLHGTLFFLSFGMLPGRAHAGGACVVSVKVARTAVSRNRVRRVVRELLVTRLRTSTAVLICVAKKGADTATAADIRAEVGGLLKKIDHAR